MNNLTQLTAYIDDCLASVDAHPKHDLTLGRRRRLWSLIGDQSAGPTQPPSRAHWVRYDMARLSIEKVQDHWPQDIEQPALVREAIELSDLVMVGRIDRNIAWQRHGEMWTACDNIAYARSDLHDEVCAGYGAVQLIAVALRDELFDQNENPWLTDMNVDPEDFDCSFCACAASSNGPVWIDGSDSGKRRDFWYWWLKFAIPAAFSISRSSFK